jgi:hypothetical protein
MGISKLFEYYKKTGRVPNLPVLFSVRLAR